MEGYQLRSRSVPSDTWALVEVSPPQSSESHLTPEGPVEGAVPVGQCLVSAGRPGAYQEHQASSSRSGATLRALLTEPLQEVCDVCALEDTGEIPDPEAEAYANVGASTSLPDPAVGATANVGAPTSPPVLDVVVAANVGKPLT